MLNGLAKDSTRTDERMTGGRAGTDPLLDGVIGVAWVGLILCYGIALLFVTLRHVRGGVECFNATPHESSDTMF